MKKYHVVIWPLPFDYLQDVTESILMSCWQICTPVDVASNNGTEQEMRKMLFQPNGSRLPPLIHQTKHSLWRNYHHIAQNHIEHRVPLLEFSPVGNSSILLVRMLPNCRQDRIPIPEEDIMEETNRQLLEDCHCKPIPLGYLS